MEREDAIAALISLPTVQRISVADLKPTDVLVIECEGRVSQETASNIKRVMEQLWPSHKCAVLDAGSRLKVVDGPVEVERT